MDETFDYLDDEPPDQPAAANRRQDRVRLTKAERFALDAATADRLEAMGRQARPAYDVFLQDVETGRELPLQKTLDRWVFSRSAQGRAAEMSALFEAYADGAAPANLHLFTLRPSGRKATLGQLAEELKRFSRDHDLCIGKLKQQGFLRPIFVAIHIRFDAELQLWDIHAHCVFQIATDQLDRVHMRLARYFSLPWRDCRSIGNIKAFVTYASTWVIDHRDVAAWPDAALLELWELRRPQFLRPAGAFADFKRRVKGKTLRWSNGAVLIEDREPRSSGRKGPRSRVIVEEQVGYAMARFDGQERFCAIIKRHRSDRHREVPEGTDRRPGRSPLESTTNTAMIPTTPIPDSPASVRKPLSRPSARQRRQIELWLKIWPYGPPSRPTRPIPRRGTPRPIRRRLQRP